MRGEHTHSLATTTTPGRAIAQAPAHGAIAAPVTLRIVGGPQAGIETALAPGRFRIGRDLSNDIVLADPSVAPVHALLLVDAEGARLQPLAPGPALPRCRIAPGTEAELRLGETLLSIAAHPATLPAASRWRRLPLLGGIAAVLLGLASAALAAVALVPSLSQPISAARAPEPPAAHRPAIVAPPSDTLQALADRLAEAGLAETITLTRSAGVLLARGTLPPDAMAAWRGVQEWYDAAHPQGPVLLREVTVARLADRPRLSVQAVWTGPMPYLIAADGERYGEGAVIDGGWTIERIEPARILLSRAGRTVALAF
jgi:type III secretion protein D